MKGKKVALAVSWFVLQFLYNLLTKTDGIRYFAVKCIVAFEYFLAPIQIVAAVIALVAISTYPWKKRPVPTA